MGSRSIEPMIKAAKMVKNHWDGILRLKESQMKMASLRDSILLFKQLNQGPEAINLSTSNVNVAFCTIL